MIDLIRTLFKIRTERSIPPVTMLPKPGASIIKDRFKIKLMLPCSPEVWVWLVDAGWRECPVRHDRRNYTLLHKDTIHYLNTAAEDKRQRVLEHFLAGKSPPRAKRSSRVS